MRREDEADEADRESARAAIGPRPAPHVPVSPFSGRWAVPVTLAAVVVLSVTVIVLMPAPDSPLAPPYAPADAPLERDAVAPASAPVRQGEAQAPAAPPAKQLAGRPATDAASGQARETSPRALIAAIREHLEAGEHVQALRLAARYRERFPDSALPADLERRLKALER